ncbi:MAG: hypothetical protein ACI89X_001905 [Planctomycetota bacterium]|jgi:hypothetical protein
MTKPWGRAVWLALPLLLSMQGALAQAPSVSGNYFTVTYEGGDERMAKQALAVVEPVWPLVCAAFGVKRARPKERLSVVLYRDVDGYLKADQKLTGGKFGPNQAMSHWDSKSAHVAMQPPCDDGSLAEHGLPFQTQVMLAWEACHIVRFELCPNFRSHPGWFHDGLAATTAKAVLRQLHPKMGQQSFFTQRWWRVRRLVEAGDMPSVSALLADQTQDLDMRDRYAARIAFYEFVHANYPTKMVKMAKAVRATGGGTGYAGKVQKVADRMLGSLGKQFVANVSKREITWDESVRSLWLFGGEWRQRAFANRKAIAFAAKTVSGGAFHAKGKVFIRDGLSRQMNFLFAKSDAGYYSLALTAGTGWTLFDHRIKGNEWRVVSRGNESKMIVDKDVLFELRGKGSKLTVKLAGRSWKVDLPRDLPEELRWGIGAEAGEHGARVGTFGIWRDVKVTGW